MIDKNMDSFEYDIFIEGEIVDFAAINEELICKTNYYKWFNDEEITRDMQHHRYPNSLSLQIEYFKSEIEGNKNRFQVGVVHKKDKLLIGMATLFDIDRFNQRCELSVLIGQKSYRNPKLFVEVVELLSRHAFYTLNIKRLYGGVLAKVGCEIFTRVLGWKEEGIRRKHVYNNGIFHDVYMLGILRKEYEENHRNTK